jgi:ssDNA-binding replication factor A large subunit
MKTRAIAEWQRAPKDGSVINVEFQDGEIRQARWDFKLGDWQVPRPDGDAVPMRWERRDLPQDWWPEF